MASSHRSMMMCRLVSSFFFLLLLEVVTMVAPTVSVGSSSSGGGGGTCDARGTETSCHASTISTTTTTTLVNTALVFIKPHANTAATRDLVVDQLTRSGIEILAMVDINGEEIDRRGLIDQHYYSIASKATLLSANEIPVPADAFEEAFNESWDVVLAENRACNAMEACRRFDCTPAELNEVWSKADAIKFGGGFYCAKISRPDGETGNNDDTQPKDKLYVFNGFFMAMRDKFVGADKEIRCYVVQWDPKVLSWKHFRSHVLGPTDPHQAPEGSIRRTILDKWQKLGLATMPNQSDNGVHASASPFEGLAERINWMGLRLQDDAFARSLVKAGVPQTTLLAWTKDPQIHLSADGDQYGSVFDELEDLDAADCAQELIELSRFNRANADTNV